MQKLRHIKLLEQPTDAPADLDKKEAQEITRQRVKQIGKLQEVLMASRTHSLLVIFQGMDGSGKDGGTRNIFSECAPYGLRTYSFKRPTEEEFAHDFLWRVHKQVPAKGEMVIFNRSHYEDILIQRVHRWINEERVRQRMQAINHFETMLQQDSNTVVLKFFLHISYEQQSLELQERINDPEKHWKHNPGDWKEREHWTEYMRCYEDVLNWSELPWHIIPVDQRWYRDYLVSGVVLEALENLQLEYPPLINAK